MLTQNIFATSIERILRGENLHDFGEWFAKESAAYSPDLPEFKEPGTWRRSALLTARAIWAQVPVPSNGWRARGLPEIGRNDACYCGSGHKYKQCCEPNARNFHLPQEIDMRWITLCELEGEQLIQCVRAMPADMLGEAGLSWNLQGRPEQTVAAMEELFSGAHKLNDRHETALDALLSAYLDMGLESKRLALAQRLVSHPAKELASCAALRWVGMLSDSGQTAQAWAVFQQAKQRNPRYVPWLYSEMTLLISEGRQDEARQRAPLLAAQARKIGIPELADAILAMGERGLAGLNDIRDPQADDDNAFDPDDADIERDIAAFKAWVALIPEQLDMQAASAMYETIVLDDFDSPIAKALPRAIELRKSKALANLDKRWHRQFAVEKPETTNLYGDPVDCFDQEAQVLAFLTKNPQAWFSWDIVDDLLLCAADLRDDASPPELKSAILKLSQWAVQLLRASTEGHAAQLPWAIMNNRPALRCLAQAIQTAADRHDNAVCEQWLSWGLQLNPNDNHGWRELLVERYMHTGRFDEALEVLLRYPSDFPPALHQRSLCYFVQGQPEQAEAILRTASMKF